MFLVFHLRNSSLRFLFFKVAATRISYHLLTVGIVSQLMVNAYSLLTEHYQPRILQELANPPISRLVRPHS